MKRMFLLFSLFFVLLASSVFSQTIQTYVKETRGDTLVVKDDSDFGKPNALYLLLRADTVNVPAGRVYMLRKDGYYSLVNNPTSSTKRKVIIMGQDNSSLKTRTEKAAPPIVCGATGEGINTTGGMSSGKDLVVKNANLVIGNINATMGWNFFGFQGANQRLTVENCIIEHTQWIQVNPGAGTTTFIKNCYMLNQVGHACRRNGGIIDFFSSPDTVWSENNTHVWAQGLQYKSRTGYTMKRWVFNHDTFVNISNLVFMNRGEVGNVSMTNNIFINSNIQGASGVAKIDDGENDPGDLGIGIVNTFDNAAFQTNGGKYYVDRNLIYWDPTFNDYISTLNTNKVNKITNWKNQMVKYNSRTKAMFDDNVKYPYLTEGTWIEGKLPKFVKTADLLSATQIAKLKTYSLATVDTTSTAILVDWRQPGNDAKTYYTYADWPLPINLSYTDTDLLTAGLNGFPLGDLGWFPTQYKNWLAQRDKEYASIHTVLTTGKLTDVQKTEGLPVAFQLDQNYPNPFNPSTVINFSIPKAGNVTLKVYNAVGQEVATLVDGYKDVSNYKVTFDASKLASGIYFYSLNAGNFTQTKKMMLVK